MGLKDLRERRGAKHHRFVTRHCYKYIFTTDCFRLHALIHGYGTGGTL